ARYLSVLPRCVVHISKAFVDFAHVPRTAVEDPLRCKAVISIGVLCAAPAEGVRGQRRCCSSRLCYALEQAIDIGLYAVLAAGSLASVGLRAACHRRRRGSCRSGRTR
ncbi:hypothetical protein F441_22887, partial [Phytophthora nicotianae CJ01A1]